MEITEPNSTLETGYEITSPSSMSTEAKIFRGYLHLAEQDIRARLSASDPSLYDCLLGSIYFRQLGDQASALKILSIHPGTNIYEAVQNRLASYCHQLNWRGALEAARDALATAANLWTKQQQDHLAEVIRVLSLLEAEADYPSDLRARSLETSSYFNLDSNSVATSLGLIDGSRQAWRVIDASFDSISQCWLELPTLSIVTELLQPSYDFRSFFGGARPWEASENRRSATIATIHEPAVFIEVNAHYGHFITQSASFAAAIQYAKLLTSPRHPEIIVLSKSDIPDWGKLFLQSSCSNPLRFKILDPQSPLRVRRLVVLPPTFIEWHYIHKNHRNLFSRSAATLLRGKKLGGEKRIYFSRSCLTNGLRRSVNEEQLEKVLVDKGFQIVHPQMMSLGEVVEIVNQSSIIVGAMGSAMHNTLFRKEADSLITLTLAHHLPGINSSMIERCCGVKNNLYIRSCEEVTQDAGPSSLYFDISRCLEGVDRALSLLP